MVVDNIHLWHVGEGNMKIYSPKSIMLPSGNMILVGEYIFIFPFPPELSFFDRTTSEALVAHHLKATVTMWFLNI
jgi:hypothetical protein